MVVETDREYRLFIGGELTERAASGHRIAARITLEMVVGIKQRYAALPGIPSGGYVRSGAGCEPALETLDLSLGKTGVVTSTSVHSINPLGL